MMSDLDHLVDRLTAPSLPTTTIIRPYNPRRPWLWRQWSGTVFELTWRQTVLVALVATANCAAVQYITHGNTGWDLFALPDQTGIAVGWEEALSKVWGKRPGLTHNTHRPMCTQALKCH